MSNTGIENPEDEHRAVTERLRDLRNIANKRIEILKSIQNEFGPLSVTVVKDDDPGGDHAYDEDQRKVADAIITLAQDTAQLWDVINDLAQSYLERRARGQQPSR